MKRKLTCMILALTVVAAGTSASFGAIEPDVDTSITPVQNATMEFTGEEIKLSLEDAIKRMQTEGTLAEDALLLKKIHENAAKGSAEAISQMREISKGSVEGLTGVQLTLAKKHAQEFKEVAYKAMMNGIESTTVNLYYGILQAQENHRIAVENTKIKDTLYNHTKLKFDLGEIAKIDLLQAETAKMEAKSQEDQALTALTEAKMRFNKYMGYDLMQKVTLTDKLTLIDAPVTPLTEAINSAFKNRNEIFEAKYNWEAADLGLKEVHAYPRDSATYMGKQLAFNSAQIAYRNQVTDIEIEIRTLHTSLQQAKDAITLAQAAYDNAKEGARLHKLQYDAGLCTMAQLQDAQNMEYKAQLGVYKAITDYDLAWYAFSYAQDVGGAASAGGGGSSSGGQGDSGGQAQ